MIDKETLNKVCPVPEESAVMNEIKTELDEQGFIINNFNKGGIFYIIIRIFVMIMFSCSIWHRRLLITDI